MTAEDMLSSEAGIQRLLANLYGYIPMSAFSQGDMNTMFANHSRSVPSYGTGGVISGFWNYTNMRSINKFIESLEQAAADGIITEQSANYYRGEAMAIRAYCYFTAVARYGGIPIVEETLDDKYDGGENLGLYFPRKTEKESWDWVLDQFQQAADLLPVSLGRYGIDKYTALGLKARAALWAASEAKYWNRAAIDPSFNAVQKKLTYMEAAWADDYYKQAIDAAADVIENGPYSLYGAAPSDVASAVKNLEDLFQTFNTTEGMFGRSYVDGNSSTSNGTSEWTANQFISNKYLIGTYSATLNIADEYDNYDNLTSRNSVDGKIITRNDAQEDYAISAPEDNITTVAHVADYKRYDRVSEPFELKDARFQAWFLYPGATFRSETVNIQGGMVTPAGASVYPEGNPTFDLNGTTYYTYGALETETSAFWNLRADVNANNRSFYSFMIKKFMDLAQYNPTPESPWYDLRFAEVLLTYAEAVVENTANYGDKAKAAEYLNAIRHRAGFKDDVALTLDNVMHEWKVEFAFENKWSQVLYRRRAFYNTTRTETILEEQDNNKYTLIPMVDLSGSEAKYIFVRAIPYCSSPKFQNYNGVLSVSSNTSYYSGIPNYVNNKIEENNK